MITTTFKIGKRNYKMFTININGNDVNVASFALNNRIEKMIEQDRYHEVSDIDKLYYYFLPKEVDDTCEREVYESITDVYEG